jgi:hypothetical protein
MIDLLRETATILQQHEQLTNLMLRERSQTQKMDNV